MRFWLWFTFVLSLSAGILALIQGNWLWLAFMCFLAAFNFYLATMPGRQQRG